MFGLKQKLCGSEAENQPAMKKSRESICYEDLSPSLLEIDTQRMDEKKEDKKISLFLPSFSSEQSKAHVLQWTDITASKRVRVITTPLGSRRMEFRIFAEQEATEKSIFLDEKQWQELQKHLSELEIAFSSFLTYGEENVCRVNLGRLHYAEFDSRFPCLQLRKYFEDPKTKIEKPTRQGITFSMREIQELKNIIPSLQEAMTVSPFTLPSYE